MKKILTALTMLCITFALGAQNPAQNGNDARKQQREQQKERLQAEHIAYLTEKLELTSEEAQVFWPVYNKAKAEQKEGNKVIGEAKKALKLAVKEGKSEKEVADALNAYIKAKNGQKNVMLDYKPQFEKVLGTVKTANLYLAEDSFRNSQIHRLGNKQGHRPQGAPRPQTPRQ